MREIKPIKVDKEIFKHIKFNVSIEPSDLLEKRIFYSFDSDGKTAILLVFKKEDDGTMVLIDEIELEHP